MKKKKAAHNCYRGEYRREVKKNSYRIGGRNDANMSNLKREEYTKLRMYVYSGFINYYGSCIALYRFYKNVKYRKRYVYNLSKNMKERNRYINLIQKIKTE